MTIRVGVPRLYYHSAYHWVGSNLTDEMAEFDKTGRSSWVGDLTRFRRSTACTTYVVIWLCCNLAQLFA